MDAPAAVALNNNAHLHELLNRVERAAIEAALCASRDDDNARRDAAIKANTIRDIRRELKRLATTDANPIPIKRGA